jgi:antitoxin (DNA-binding transcriptional repressor) of toxin-antitoxin stability system
MQANLLVIFLKHCGYQGIGPLWHFPGGDTFQPMKTTITNARREFTTLLRRAEEGEVVLLTRNGRPILELRAVPKPPQSDDQRLNEALRKIVEPTYLNGFFRK